MLLMESPPKAGTMPALIIEFERSLVAEENASAHTVRNYISDLRQLHGFLREHGLGLDDDGRAARSRHPRGDVLRWRAGQRVGGARLEGHRRQAGARARPRQGREGTASADRPEGAGGIG